MTRTPRNRAERGDIGVFEGEAREEASPGSQERPLFGTGVLPLTPARKPPLCAGQGAGRGGYSPDAPPWPARLRRGDPGGRGQEQVPERRGPEQPPHRPLAGAAAGHGGRAPHHPGAEQPPHQRGPALPRGVGHRGIGRAGGLPRGCLRHGRGQRDSRRAAAAPVSEVLPHRRRRPETGHRGVGPGPGHLQGDRGGPRGPDMGRERRAGPGGAVHLHHSGGPGRRSRRPPALRPLTAVGAGADAHSRGGRRPADAAGTSGTRSRMRTTRRL